MEAEVDQLSSCTAVIQLSRTAIQQSSIQFWLQSSSPAVHLPAVQKELAEADRNRTLSQCQAHCDECSNVMVFHCWITQRVHTVCFVEAALADVAVLCVVNSLETARLWGPEKHGRSRSVGT